MSDTRTQPTATAQADLTEQWLSSLDPARLDFRDATGVRAIIAAADAITTAQENLSRAVAQARADGDSWTVIGAALGTSKQAAHERFRTVTER